MQQEDYESLFEMFETEGWKIFIEMADTIYKAGLENAIDSVETGDQWLVLKGELSQLRRILNYEKYTKMVYENSKEAVDEEDV